MFWNKLWNWILALFRRKRPALEVTKAAEPVKKSWFQRMAEKFPTFRFVSTQRSEFNMPKYQPCPNHGKMCKRTRKVLTGAWYYCPVHGEFFVRV